MSILLTLAGAALRVLTRCFLVDDDEDEEEEEEEE